MSPSAHPSDGETAYLAAAGFERELAAELGDAELHGRLAIAPGPPRAAAWALNVWQAPQRIPIASIGDAAQALRAIQRNWVAYPFQLHRRMALIQERLPAVRPKPLAFPAPAPTAALGSWTLLAPDLLYAASRCTSPFANGEARFAEDRLGPPNRAYLKLWELFTLEGVRPGAGAHCVDLGASPGGWSWALLRLGARVTAIDKAPLALADHALLSVRRQSAFAVGPAALGRVDWLFADIACYPRRLLGLVRRWLDRPNPPAIVATIKFQGETDLAVQREFAALPRARLRHLFHNKHELTLYVPAP